MNAYHTAPRFRLIDSPTPLERLAQLEKFTGAYPLYIKRDDCITLGMGGNKVRSLEFWIGQAAADDADMIVVAGAQVSNQCRLAAAAAAKAGFECLILHTGEEPQQYDGNILLSRLMGAHMKFIGDVTEQGRGEAAAAEVASLRACGRKPYLIGDAATGAMGYVSGALELYGQAQNIRFRHVFLPGSMGTTEAGFMLGNAMMGYPFEVHLISVEYGAEELEGRIARIYDAASERMEVSLAWRAPNIHCQYLGDGYNASTGASLEAIKIFAQHEGIFLENTYTSKTAAGMLDLIAHGTVPWHEGVCFIHTGGGPALFAQQDALTPIL